MNTSHSGSMLRWWGVVVGGAAVTLFFTWLARLAGVPLSTLVSIGAGLAALVWMVVLVTLPWNLYFQARQVLLQNAASRERRITVAPGLDREARKIARLMLVFALGGHVGTAAATAVFAYVANSTLGYYLAGFYLLSIAVRPAAAYFAHLRERLTYLRREGVFPRHDVATLTATVGTLVRDLRAAETQLEGVRQAASDELRQAQRTLAGDVAHLRQQVTGDLTRLEDAQATDRAAARNRSDELAGRIEQMARRIEATLDGISDHQELLVGIRALVRMVRTDPA